MTDDIQRHSRHDFRAKTIATLAKRVAFLCSNPACRQPTVGPEQGGEGTVNVGVAAHITAASKGGPRYNPLLTPEERRHQANGIWLCQIHGKQVDSDEEHFKVETLRAWKEGAERGAAEAITRSQARRQASAAIKSDEEDIAFALKLGFASEERIEGIRQSVREAASADISGFKTLPGFPRDSIDLELALASQSSARTFDVSRLAALCDAFNEIALVASPGTGKSTTAIQLAQRLLEDEGSPTIYVPLGEWAAQDRTFFESLVTRKAFQNLRPQHFMLLAEAGGLALILDGWNELDDASRRRAAIEINAMRRDYPDLRLLVTTRQQARDVPLGGLVVRIQGLSEEKQVELARAIRGTAGEAVVDHAWRTPGLRELVSIPLYLTALVSKAPEGALPTTKEEVLRMFVDEHEKAEPRADILHQKLLGQHRTFLIGLAVSATDSGKAALLEAEARAAIRRVGDKLVADDQLSAPLEPFEVLRELVAFHILVQLGRDAVTFQHQQFQEWYASFAVEDLMRATSEGNASARRRLREEILNVRSWEEAILFACDRLSRATADDVDVVAATIFDAMEIDPLLAAEMIYRSSVPVWTKIGPSIVAFVDKWHVQRQVDSAVHFMIGTGKAEFAPEVWKLISDPDTQVHLRALRSGSRFRPAVLGQDVQEKLGKLPDQVRVHVLSEIASESGMDGIELAAEMACADASAEVKTAVIESLIFRRADRFVARILRSSPDEVWQELGRKGYASEVGDADLADRLRKEESRYSSKEGKPIERLLALRYRSDGDARPTPKEIEEIIESRDFDVDDQQARWALREAYDRFPTETCSALIHRMEAGTGIPFRSEELFRGKAFGIDEGTIVDAVFNSDERNREANAAACLVGPKTIGCLIDRVIQIRDEADAAGTWCQPLSAEYHGLRTRVANSELVTFIEVILARSEAQNIREIAELAEMIARHGAWKAEEFPLQPKQQAACVSTIVKWADILIASDRSTRAQLADLVQAIEKIPDPKLLDPLSRLLGEELRRHEKERAAFLESFHRGQRLQNQSQTSWSLQYRHAFVAIGGSEVEQLMCSYLPSFGYCGFGETAAWVLKDLTDVRLGGDPPDKPFRRSDFMDVRGRRAARERGGTESSPAATEIFAVVKRLLASDPNNEVCAHIIVLTIVGCLLPHAGQEALIESVLQLPVPMQSKERFLKILAMTGYILNADLILRGLRELLEEAKTKRWLLDQNSRRIDDWLELFPFSDRPAALFDVMGSLPANSWHINRILQTLGYAPSGDAEIVLAELARRDAGLISQHDWFSALEHLGTIAAGRVLLDCLSNGDVWRPGRDTWTMARVLAVFARTYREVRTDLYERFVRIGSAQFKDLLAHVIAETPDLDGYLLLVTDYGSANRSFNQTLLPQALRNMLTGYQESSHFKGMQETFSRPANELRKRLFALILAQDRAAQLAIDSLNEIDELREHYGSVDAEPRHPDISSNVPWPNITGWRHA